MGRKTQPTKLKDLHGNPSKTPPNRMEPKPAAAVPDAPDGLNAIAREEWDRLSAQLYVLGLLTDIDRGALAAYCQAYGRWMQAEHKLRAMAKADPVTDGLLIKTSNGNAIQNPLVGIANKAMGDMVRYAAEFGMTPSARSRIQAEGRELPDAPGAAAPSAGSFESFLAAKPDAIN